MKQSFDLHRLRQRADQIVLCAAWALVLLNSAVGLAMHDWMAPTLSALGFALVTQGAVRRARFTPLTRALPAVAVMASLSLVVNGLAGPALQVDLHMAYFASLAVLVAYCDWRIIAAAAGFVAVHHLVLNVVLPEAIYPGGSNFGRFLVHAVVLVLEATTLMWVAMMLERMFAALADEAAQTEAALAAAQASNMAVLEATRASEAERAQHEASRQASEEARHRVITRVGEGLHRLAQGDLTTRVDGLAGEFENLQDDFNAAASALEAALLEVVTKAETIRFGTAEVNDAAGALAHRAGQQADGLEQTAASLGELTATVSRNAEGAQAASTVASTARADAQRSGEVVRSAVAAMSEIENSAREIGQIIGIIDEIAFQTNLLALNAGVEAARAGETGRGFAVVASEVRALAQRSADAARDIKRLISASSQQVARGVSLVGETGTSLERIVAQVDHVARVVSDMAESVRAQAAGLQQVQSTISEAITASASNTSMVEQATHLAAESSELADLATRFRLGGVAA